MASKRFFVTGPQGYLTQFGTWTWELPAALSFTLRHFAEGQVAAFKRPDIAVEERQV